MANRIQLNIEVPKREKVGGDTKPPKVPTRRAYIVELYKYFGFPVPQQWQTNASPEPVFSEPEATGET
jgi:hypothetical protein